MDYILKVEWDEGDNVIEIGGVKEEKPVITSAEVWLDTIDDDTSKKSKAMLARVNIKGKFLSGSEAPKLKEKLRDIFLWAMDFKMSTTYRKVTLTVKEDEETVFRTYEFDKIFVRDYKEIFKNSDEEGSDGDKGGTFELDLTQQDNQLDTIEVL